MLLCRFSLKVFENIVSGLLFASLFGFCVLFKRYIGPPVLYCFVFVYFNLFWLFSINFRWVC